MKTSKVFLEAAKLVDASFSLYNGELSNNCGCCCGAIHGVAKDPFIISELTDLFGQYFKPKSVSYEDFWFGSPWPNQHTPSELLKVAARKQHRVMALLFMAEISKDSE